MAVNLQLFGMAAGFIQKLIKAGQYKPLSDAQIEFLSTKGAWIINAELRVAPLGPVLNEAEGDCNVYPGQGVPDLDTIQMLMDHYPWGRFAVDVGGPDSFSEYVYIGTNDVVRWRNRFIQIWGTVSRPEYYASTLTVVPPQYVPPGTNWP
jgi:hypothetical protein